LQHKNGFSDFIRKPMTGGVSSDFGFRISFEFRLLLPPFQLTLAKARDTFYPMIAASAGAGQAKTPANYRVGDERLVKVTASAAEKVRSLLTKQGRTNGVLRVAVVGGGCSGLQYKMDLQDGPANRDILVESSGIKVVVDPKSALYVTGSELDYIDALQGGGFKVKNPNAATSCSCGESFSA
jgi:iron-sulfur cluster assembly accessory protein